MKAADDFVNKIVVIGFLLIGFFILAQVFGYTYKDFKVWYYTKDIRPEDMHDYPRQTSWRKDIDGDVALTRDQSSSLGFFYDGTDTIRLGSSEPDFRTMQFRLDKQYTQENPLQVICPEQGYEPHALGQTTFPSGEILDAIIVFCMKEEKIDELLKQEIK